MKDGIQLTVVIVLIVVGLVGFMLLQGGSFDLPKGETTPISELLDESSQADVEMGSEKEIVLREIADDGDSGTLSSRQVFVTEGVRHSISIGEIRQGCFGRDCIPSVDDPKYVSKEEADEILPADTIGIGLSYEGENRFYPFNMLVTREIVNDVVGGKPLAVTYCPLCGTGIVFGRQVGDNVFEFGVSGMLWQSNLLMYNREDKEEDISLWSQVLGEAVLGTHTGTKLEIVPSDIVRYTDWAKLHNDTKVLNTGKIGDPYRGEYYRVARGFSPNFDEETSLLSPTAYVFGLEIDGEFKAYPDAVLTTGEVTDEFAGKKLRIEKEEGGIVRIYEQGSSDPLPIVSGFWFSWVAAHPETELF